MYSSLSVKERAKVRKAYVVMQKGNCYYCGNDLTEPVPEHIKEKQVNENLFPLGFFIYPVHLHHSHDTGLTLGAVHSYCNAVLWQYHGE